MSDLNGTLRRRAKVRNMHAYLEKAAADKGTSEATKAFLYTLGGGLASAGVAYGIPAAIESIRGARIRANKDKLVGEMRKAHPELKDYSKRDVDLVYNSLSMHSPKVLRDPLLGGQIMVEALRRGNHMDMGQLSNVSRMTGGTGVSDHEREAANIFAQQMGRGVQDYAGRKYDAATDTRLQDSIKVERVKGEENRKSTLFRGRKEGLVNKILAKKYEDHRKRTTYVPKDEDKARYTAEAKYEAYKSTKSP